MITKNKRLFIFSARLSDKQKGSSLLLTILIMSFILGISLGISNILLQEAKMTRDIGNSVIAFYAADTGIEKSMMSRSAPSGFDEFFPSPYNDIRYSVRIMPGVNCSADNYCIQSQGIYRNTRRAIETQY